MARHEFGEPISEDDILVVQGVEYPMVPIGMRAMKRMLTIQREITQDRADDAPLTEKDLDLAVDIVTSSVRPEFREKLVEHVDESVPPDMLINMAHAVMSGFSDLDPTVPESSSGGSLQTGPDSTAGVSPAPSTPRS